MFPFGNFSGYVGEMILFLVYKRYQVSEVMEMEEPLRSKVEDLIQYQEGAVVSRTLIDKKEGTVTVFSFDKEQGLSEHTTPYDAMVQILDGKASIVISGEEFIMEKGEMIIMPANEPHALKAISPFKMMLTMIRA